MFFDLNIPLPVPSLLANYANLSKQKQSDAPLCLFSAVQIAALETRIDLLVHLGYTVLALSQVCQSKIDGKTHVDHISGLIPKLKKRPGIQLLRRLTIVLDEASEKGNGINTQNVSVLSSYDILAVQPSTSGTFSAACLTLSVPSQTTTHIISIPISHAARLPYYLKHTLIRTALSNGSVLEINYAGALTSDDSERKFWWGGLREVIRVTKGKGLLLSGGIEFDKDARAPRDAANLITLAGLAQNLSHDAISQTAKTIVLRAYSRKTYRSILSEPTLILPSVTPNLPATVVVSDDIPTESVQEAGKESTEPGSAVTLTSGQATSESQSQQGDTKVHLEISQGSKDPSSTRTSSQLEPKQGQKGKGNGHPSANDEANASTAISSGQVSRDDGANIKKRPRADSDHRKSAPVVTKVSTAETSTNFNGRAKKKKKKH